MSDHVHVAIFTEGEFHSVRICKSVEEARAYTSGFYAGADAYGSGTVGCYVLPDDAEDLSDDHGEEGLKRTARGIIDAEAETKKLAEDYAKRVAQAQAEKADT